ncbi:hypothetical protein GGR57DRAFT_220502 [Xylariaceae sp. FL1272]|nr:hypothetical protein GGR57DRAFT_220502 [Xylariaceae sp. FL1272]
MDDDVAQFMMITGIESEHVARGYLQISGNIIAQAIVTFYDNPELASSFNAPPEAQTTSTTHAPQTSRTARIGREDASGTIHIDSDSDDGDVPMTDDDNDESDNVAAIARTAQEEEDAAMARRLQEELYGSGSGGAGADDGVRAPIAQTTETLAGPGSMPWSLEDEREAAVLEQLQARRHRQQRRAQPRNPFDQSPSIWDDPEAPPVPNSTRPGAAVAGDGITSRAAHLRDLFRPPHELIAPFTWDEARDEGKEEKKWIMVNLQNMDDFNCQVLNRDIWKDQNIEALIKEHFIFLQYDKREPRAQSFIQFYFPNESHENDENYPHVSIVDPRTGEQVKVWSGLPFPKAGEFYQDVIEFLDRYSLAVNSKNPVSRSKPQAKQVDVGRLTEDEMLQLAMQNSLDANGGSSGSSVQDPDMLTKSSDNMDKGKGRDADNAVDLTGTSEPARDSIESEFARISSDHPHVEPENNPATTTRIQFRHSGGRIIRRFAVTEPVSRLFEWLKAEPFEGKEGVRFELKSMPAGTDLIGELGKTIEEAGLKQGTVMIEFVED